MRRADEGRAALVRLTSYASAAALSAFVGCGGGSGASPALGISPPPIASPSPKPFLPLAVGDVWTYACYLGTPAPLASTFPKTNQVLGTTDVGGTQTFEYAIQIPSSATLSTTEIQLLANDAAGDTIIYGYVASPGAAPSPLASPAFIIAHAPTAGETFDYDSQAGSAVSRFFWGTESTHETALGTFTVDAYFEGSHSVSGATDGYGYAAGLGSMEEDHDFNDPNPAKRIDCLITTTPAP
jgi:hypothetical protein